MPLRPERRLGAAVGGASCWPGPAVGGASCWPGPAVGGRLGAAVEEGAVRGAGETQPGRQGAVPLPGLLGGGHPVPVTRDKPGERVPTCNIVSHSNIAGIASTHPQGSYRTEPRPGCKLRWSAGPWPAVGPAVARWSPRPATGGTSRTRNWTLPSCSSIAVNSKYQKITTRPVPAVEKAVSVAEKEGAQLDGLPEPRVGRAVHRQVVVQPVAVAGVPPAAPLLPPQYRPQSGRPTDN